MAEGKPHEGTLESEREEAVLDAALDVFGRDGYRRAHTEEIARRAGMSKGLLFYYFSSKERLYRRTAEWLTERVERIVLDEEYWEIDDFFELMLYVARKSRDVLARSPRFTEFSIGLYYPDRSNGHGAMSAWLAAQADEAAARYFKNVRLDRFRGADGAGRAMELLAWLTDGWLHQRRMAGERADLAALCEEMEEWCAMLRSWLYKEEYL